MSLKQGLGTFWAKYKWPVIWLVFVAAVVQASLGRSAPPAKPLGWMTDYAAAARLAKAKGEPLFVDFDATWCEPCQEMKSEVYSTAKFKAATQCMVLVEVDVDANKQLAAERGVVGIPDVRIYAPDGVQLASVNSYDGTTDELYAAILSASNAR